MTNKNWSAGLLLAQVSSRFEVFLLHDPCAQGLKLNLKGMEDVKPGVVLQEQRGS